MNEENRKNTLIILFLSVGVIYLIRLFFLQVVEDKWKVEAANMSERRVTVYPARGLIQDRAGKLLVANTPVYDLMVTPGRVEEVDTAFFCRLTGITGEEYHERMEAARHYSYQKPSVFIKQIPADQYASIAEYLYLFPGFFGQARTLRSYPLKTAAHCLGYIGEVGQSLLKKEPYYRQGDYIGVSGLEREYERELRGKRGVRYVVVDVHNNEKGSYRNGQYDTLSHSGNNLLSTLDADLQRYGEYLMQNKRGSVVAIEPATGEILALVSQPTYDPNLLIGRIRNKNYNRLVSDTLKPLFNRAIMAKYPPGSTFKLINALIGLQEGVLTPQTTYSCYGGYYYAGRRMGCHAHPSPLQLEYSIQTSCNAYYANVFKSVMDKYPSTEVSYKKWRSYLRAFGLGDELGIDLANENEGFVPDAAYYNRLYGEGHWNGHTIISLAIGQGELGITPMQMANMCASIANRGYYITPHLVKSVEGNSRPHVSLEKNPIPIDSGYFEMVVEGMRKVVQSGTGRGVDFDRENYPVCGKTGTAQNPHGKDHSIFIAFAPKEDPKIALAVYVENVGFGSTWAAPIASLMIEQYLTDSISRPQLENRIAGGNLLAP